MQSDIRQILDDGLSALGPRYDAAMGDALADFLDTLAHWNQRVGLTAVTDPAQMVTRHAIDSLSVEPWLQGPRVIDVGTGPGLPGIPLAIARPDLEFTLLDSLEKRTTFIRQVVWKLGLTNVDVITDRVQAYRPDAKFDTLVTRAFASLEETLDRSRHLCHGRFLAMKGKVPETEIEALEAGVRAVTQSYPVTVPGLDAERCVVVIQLN